ncbi:Wzt carbohydrate-binding domain-containing protein [Pseudotenacibaculum sp. MALMAid0570]|uniref:Wzt carbohydrate-binding domain-containing protein n=1 Tax=Pseudotenacibaculum sp. MALMAid0570 TaxID=3143938 RepID=UPI0032DFD335
MNVFVDFDTSKIDNLSFGYVLKNEKNQILFAENSYQKENSMKVIKEKKQFEITFQNLALSPGSYSLSLYLGNGKLDIDIIEDAITFMVFWDTETNKKPPLKEFGSLYLETKWRY